MVLDSQGSLVHLDLLVQLWGQMFPDLWETLDSLDWMESMVSKVLQVLPVHLVQARPRETEVTLGSRASQAPPVGKGNQASPEATDSPAAPGSKEHEVRLASAEVLVSRVSPVTLVIMGTKEPRDYEGVPVVKVSLESCFPREASSDPSEKWVFPVQAETLVLPENPVSRECPDVLVLMAFPVPRGNSAGLDLLVCPEVSVTPDRPVSPDPLENKVPLVQPAAPALPAASAAATASATLW